MGQHGKIGTPVQVGPSKYKARAYYRAVDGKRYTMARFGQTKAAARRALETALAEWQQETLPPSPNMRLGALFDAWIEEVRESDRAIGTVQLYEHMTNRLRPALEALTVREVTTGYCDKVLRDIAADTPSAASTARKVLRAAMSYAIRQGLLRTNPVRETRPISAKPKKVPRALSRDEVEELTSKLRVDERAVMLDLPDLVDFMLATGCRIGEACAVRDAVLDLDVGTVEINATVIREKGKGLVLQERPKTAAGWRILALPGYAMEMLRRREHELRWQTAERVLFPSSHRPSLRDPSNTQADLRAAFDRAGFPWATSHTLRKTVATRLDEAGWSARQIADQLGHAQPSLTMDVYMGRKVVGAGAAEVLDR